MICKRKMTEQGKNVLDRSTASSVAAVVDLDHAMTVAVDRDLGVQMFIRFVVGADGEHHRYLTGLITEADPPFGACCAILRIGELLAMARPNSGPGNVSRALSVNGKPCRVATLVVMSVPVRSGLRSLYLRW